MMINKERSLRAQKAAQEIIEQYYIETPEEIVLENVAVALGLVIRKENLSGACARVVHNGNTGIIDYDESLLNNTGRMRFAIAHEIGHFILHKADTYLKKCSEKDLETWFQSSNKIEAEANYFASELLLPTKFIEHYCDEEINLDLIQEISRKFNTSITATALKYAEVTYKPCAVVFSKDSKIQWFSKNDDFIFWIDKGSALEKSTEAYNYFAGKNINGPREGLNISSWTTSDDDYEHYINEYSMSIPCIKSVLTLLTLKNFS